MKVLDTLMTKDDLDMQISHDNYSQYMVNRYLSFISPLSCIFVNENYNQFESFPDAEEELQYAMTKASFPKMKKQYIKYKRKPQVSKQIELKYTEEDIDCWAQMMEVSKHEIRDYIIQIENLKNNEDD